MNWEANFGHTSVTFPYAPNATPPYYQRPCITAVG